MDSKTKQKGKDKTPGFWRELYNELFDAKDMLSGHGDYDERGQKNKRLRRDESKKSGWWNE